MFSVGEVDTSPSPDELLYDAAGVGGGLSLRFSRQEGVSCYHAVHVYHDTLHFVEIGFFSFFSFVSFILRWRAEGAFDHMGCVRLAGDTLSVRDALTRLCSDLPSLLLQAASVSAPSKQPHLPL